jgi:hypothetical protein
MPWRWRFPGGWRAQIGRLLLSMSAMLRRLYGLPALILMAAMEDSWSVIFGRKIDFRFLSVDGNSPERLKTMDESISTVVGNSSGRVAPDAESLSAVVGKSIRRTGRPAKVVDLKAVCVRLRAGHSLRSVARSLRMSHSTLREHLQRSGLLGGLDY